MQHRVDDILCSVFVCIVHTMHIHVHSRWPKKCYVSICRKKLEDGELGSSARLLYMRHAKVVKVRNPL